MGSSSPRSRPTVPLLKQPMDMQLIKPISQLQPQSNQHKSQSVSSASKFEMKNNKQLLNNNNDKPIHQKSGLIG
jgi:hypothetical protein